MSVYDEGWSVAEAKAKLSSVIEAAHSRGPQLITKHGRPAAVVVGVDEWEERTRRKGSLSEFLANSPLRDSGISL